MPNPRKKQEHLTSFYADFFRLSGFKNTCTA